MSCFAQSCVFQVGCPRAESEFQPPANVCEVGLEHFGNLHSQRVVVGPDGQLQAISITGFEEFTSLVRIKIVSLNVRIEVPP